MIAHIHMPSGVPFTALSADGIVGLITWVIHIGAAGAMVASQVGV